MDALSTRSDNRRSVLALPAFKELLDREALSTLFLVEGVTLYLEEETVRTTLRDIAERAAPGSVLTLDIYAQKMIDDLGRAERILEYTNEALSFGLPMETGFEGVLTDFVESEGLRLGETFFLGRTHRTGPYAVVAEVLV